MLKNHYVTKLINLEGVKFKNIDIQDDKVRVLVAPVHDVHLCPKCCRPTSLLVDIKPKVYRDLDLAGRRCYIEIDLRRFECRDCFCTFTEPLSFAASHRRYTSRFENEIYESCRETTATYTSKFGISDKIAAEIYQTIAKRKQKQPQTLLPTKVIGLDEIAMHKGHKDFVLVISDITNKRVIDVLKDRKKATLEAYMADWSDEFKAGIESVAIDLWGPYRSVVESMLPNAQAVADRFHVMHNLNKALDNCRKQAKRESEDKEIWKDAKYAVLKNREDLTEEQKRILSKVLTASSDLRACYELKESFRGIFNDSNDRETGTSKLYGWVLDIVRQEVSGYYEFVRTFLNWEENILNYFDDWVSSGFVEGVNNKIKLIKRKAFGFVNFENFRIKIIDCFS
ncbi:MAG TPA: ISL3 family transposase [Parachlamydiaceae bacterium]|nr:ISL3 family transposase [Parachlamydiaceae bacterium]